MACRMYWTCRCVTSSLKMCNYPLVVNSWVGLLESCGWDIFSWFISPNSSPEKLTAVYILHSHPRRTQARSGLHLSLDACCQAFPKGGKCYHILFLWLLVRLNNFSNVIGHFCVHLWIACLCLLPIFFWGLCLSLIDLNTLYINPLSCCR